MDCIRHGSVDRPVAAFISAFLTMLDQWLFHHARIAAGITAIVALFAAIAPPIAMSTQLVLLAGLVALLGLPHGAVDHWQGRALVQPHLGRAWWLVFGAGYAATALIVIVAWMASPPLLLVGFLILAAAHFGSEDVAARPAIHRANAPLRIIDAGVRGSLPVLLPIAFHPGETAALFAALLPYTDSAQVEQALTPIAHASPVYIGALGALTATALMRGDRVVGAEIIALGAVFATLPPLLAFAVYFCLWHSPRHSLFVIADGEDQILSRGIVRFAAAAIPLTMLTIAAGALAWFGLRDLFTDAEATLQVVFIGLAALTVPHVILPLLSRRLSPRYSGKVQ